MFLLGILFFIFHFQFCFRTDSVSGKESDKTNKSLDLRVLALALSNSVPLFFAFRSNNNVPLISVNMSQIFSVLDLYKKCATTPHLGGKNSDMVVHKEQQTVNIHQK